MKRNVKLILQFYLHIVKIYKICAITIIICYHIYLIFIGDILYIFNIVHVKVMYYYCMFICPVSLRMAIYR